MMMGVSDAGVVTGVGCEGSFSVMTLLMRLQAARSPEARARPGRMRTLFRKGSSSRSDLRNFTLSPH
jgi:hypothetical protein